MAGLITTWDEVTTLGIWLHCDPNDLERLQSENNSIKGAAYKVLRSFYKKTSNSEEKVQMLSNALTELGKQTVIGDINLNSWLNSWINQLNLSIQSGFTCGTYVKRWNFELAI